VPDARGPKLVGTWGYLRAVSIKAGEVNGPAGRGYSARTAGRMTWLGGCWREHSGMAESPGEQREIIRRVPRWVGGVQKKLTMGKQGESRDGVWRRVHS